MFLCLAGGVGGAKLARGFAGLTEREIVVVVNTGDDFEHLGLYIAPDLDTVTYNLADLNNTEVGWGVRGETWNFMAALSRLGGPDWFKLGDQDLATHIWRAQMLAQGKTLSQITKEIAVRLMIETRIVPMSDDRVRTMLETDRGRMEFQDYFVRARCEPVVQSITYAGATSARRSPDFEESLADPRLKAIVICPSNPFLSIDPILALADTRARLTSCKAPIVAVSPVVGGEAIKGPTVKIMRELGLQPSSKSVAAHYRNFIDGLVIDESDAREEAAIRDLGLKVLVAPTVMRSVDDKIQLARRVVDFALRCGKASR